MDRGVWIVCVCARGLDPYLAFFDSYPYYDLPEFKSFPLNLTETNQRVDKKDLENHSHNF